MASNPRSPLRAAWLLGALLACAGASSAAPGDGVGDRGRISTGLATRVDPSQNYDLYLPTGYPGDKRWPVLLILDPRGRGEWILEQARPGADRHGWILMASRQSRSDGPEQVTLTALQALLREVTTMYAYDPKRVYIAGMSGTAKSLWVAEESLHGLVAGYIGAGGGRPPELGRIARAPPPYFGFAGRHDFNFQEMRELDDALAGAGATHRLQLFAGAHGWPRDPGAFSDAIDWLEMMAMRDGRAPRREDWIDVRFATEQAAAAAASTPLQRWRRFDQIARDFAGLRDVTADRASAARWQTDPETKRLLALERRLHDEEQRFARQLDDWATRLNQAVVEGRRQAPPDLARTLAGLRIRSLQARARDPDALVADSATRRLERAWVAGAHYLADAQQARGDLERARVALRLASAVFPDRNYPRCRLERLAAGADALARSIQRCNRAASEPP